MTVGFVDLANRVDPNLIFARWADFVSLRGQIFSVLCGSDRFVLLVCLPLDLLLPFCLDSLSRAVDKDEGAFVELR